MKIIKYSILSFIALFLYSCGTDEKQAFIKENVDFAAAQTDSMIVSLVSPTSIDTIVTRSGDTVIRERGKYPRTTNAEGKLRITRGNDWTDGFFPGSLW